MVPLSQWCTKFCEIKQKKIHSLFTESVSLSTLVKQFNSDLMKLSGHIYRAACQWSAYQADVDSLQPGHLTMVVDYQMNGTILHKNSTTSSHMGANTAQFCIYPAFLAVRLTDGRVVRGGIIFLSWDTKHDRHQVKVFHGLIKEQMQKKYGSEVAVITRWSDQCAQQFKSQYTVHDLLISDPGLWVHWNFFEVGEGKNLSDLLGSLFKTAYLRGVATSSDTSGTAHNIKEVISLTRPYLTESSPKFYFLDMIIAYDH